MASNDKASEPADESLEGSWSPRRSKAAAAKTAKKAKSDNAATPDPEALAGDIERTREELAETLDAIADRVSPKKAAARTKKKVGDAVKDGAHEAAEAVKDGAHDAADAVKSGVAAVKEKVTPEHEAAPPAPPAPAMSVDADAAAPISGVHVPVEPAPTPGALADAAVTPVEPVGAETPETPSYPASLPPAAPSRLPVFAGAAVALVVLLLLRRRRRR